MLHEGKIMERNELVKNIVSVCTRLENLCEGFDVDSKSTLISSKFKVMLALSEQDNISPSMLIDKLGLAKSNLALLCKSMITEGLIEKRKDDFDSRVIFYTLTDFGKQKLNATLCKMADNFTTQLAYKNKFKEIEVLMTNLKDLID